MSNGIVDLPSYQIGGLLDRIKRLIGGQSEEEQDVDDRRKAAERFEKRAGPAIDDPTLRSMQPLLDSLQHMTGPVPEGDGYAGYSESGDIPFSVRPEDPQIASGEALGLYYHPSQQQQENIVIDTGSSAALRHDPRFIAMHEVGHAVDRRNPKGERGWLSPELRRAIYTREAPFNTEGQYGSVQRTWEEDGETYVGIPEESPGDAPHQRIADYIGEAIDFLQTSKNSAIDPEYTRQYLSERPHLQRLTEELLQLPIYQEHPLLTGSLGEAYEPEPESAFASSMRELRETYERAGLPIPEGVAGPANAYLQPDFTPAQMARIDELARNIDMGMSFSFQEDDTDAILNAAQRKLMARGTGPRYRSRFRPASPPTPPR